MEIWEVGELKVGGYDGSNRVNDFYKFNFKSSKWTQILFVSS